MNASQMDTRPSLSRSAAGSVSALMKYSGKTVSKRCAADSVAVMTIRCGPARRSMNGKLADVESTTTRRPGIGLSSAAQSRVSMSGPTRLNLASVPSNVPWPNQHQEQHVVGGHPRGESTATRRRTTWPSRRVHRPHRRRARRCATSSNPNVSRSAVVSAWRHFSYCVRIRVVAVRRPTRSARSGRRRRPAAPRRQRARRSAEPHAARSPKSPISPGQPLGREQTRQSSRRTSPCSRGRDGRRARPRVRRLQADRERLDVGRRQDRTARRRGRRAAALPR